MPKLSDDALHEFLAEPGHMLRLATVDADGTPRVVPIWYLYENDEILFTPRRRSVWLENLRRDPRVGMAIDEAALPYRKVTIQGPARIVHDLGEDDVWRDRYRRMAVGYIGEEAGGAYVDDTVDQPRALCAIALSAPDTRVTSWRMPLEGEDVSGIWARRYWDDGTAMAEHIASGEQRPMYGA